MKKKLLLFLCMLIAFSASAQYSESALRMSVNTINSSDSLRISNFVQQQRKSRSFIAATGMAILSSIVSQASSITIEEIMKVAQIRSNQRQEWDEMIENECYYIDSLSYMNSLTDFYKQGSFDGPLDPANLNFNGFNIKSKLHGKDVIEFYCHVATDEAGLYQIFNHSKFNLVLDSMYFHPYNCHLPNMEANGIYPDKEKDYGRNLHFNFDDRENLMVSLYFSFTSSWYNEAVMLFKDVDLGTFQIQIPVNESQLQDSVFIYKRSDIDANKAFYAKNKDRFDPESPLYDSTLVMPDTTYLSINGNCFIVPRSYMPLPGGIAHWGTGEYNVEMYLMETCNISDEIEENWHRDYKKMCKMRKHGKAGKYLVNLCKQNGGDVVKSVLEIVSDSAIHELHLE